MNEIEKNIYIDNLKLIWKKRWQNLKIHVRDGNRYSSKQQGDKIYQEKIIIMEERKTWNWQGRLVKQYYNNKKRGQSWEVQKVMKQVIDNRHRYGYKSVLREISENLVESTLQSTKTKIDRIYWSPA